MFFGRSTCECEWILFFASQNNQGAEAGVTFVYY